MKPWTSTDYFSNSTSSYVSRCPHSLDPTSLHTPGPCMQSAWVYDSQVVCMFDNFHLTFNFKSKVSHDVFKNKNECQLISTFSSKMSPQFHMPCSTCHFNLWSVNWCVGFFLHKAHYMSKFKLCMSIDVHFMFEQVIACQISKTCNFFYQKYTLLSSTLDKYCWVVIIKYLI
jgi:hypothetical protein